MSVVRTTREVGVGERAARAAWTNGPGCVPLSVGAEILAREGLVSSGRGDQQCYQSPRNV